MPQGFQLSTEFVELQAVVTLLEAVAKDALSLIQIADPSIYSLGICQSVEAVCILWEIGIFDPYPNSNPNTDTRDKCK